MKTMYIDNPETGHTAYQVRQRSSTKVIITKTALLKRENPMKMEQINMN